MQNTIMNLIDAARTFITFATQPSTTPAQLQPLVRNLEQYIDETSAILAQFPNKRELELVFEFMSAQLEGAEHIAGVIRQIDGEMDAFQFLTKMIVIGNAVSALNRVIEMDEIAGAERQMNQQPH